MLLQNGRPKPVWPVRRWLNVALTWPALSLLAGCAAVPQLGPQPLALTVDQVAAGTSLSAPASNSGWPVDGWWQAWGDPQLNALVAEGLAASPDMAAAQARLDRAAALRRQAGAAGMPRIDVQGGVQEERQSLNMGFPDAFKPGLPQGWNDGGQIAASLGFDLDLWGRNRAALAAATSQQRAAGFDLAQARLMLSVAIVSAYVDLERLMAEQTIRDAQAKAQAQTSALIQQRLANGLETAGGPAQARAAEAAARIAASQAGEAVVLRKHQLAALIGAGPDRGLTLSPPNLAALPPHDLPLDATTALLARRPDVIAARERVTASAGGIRIAKADFFPAITLSALIGQQSLGLDKLFAGDSAYGRVGPVVSLPIFHGGELKGRYLAARADFDAAVAGYNTAVLTAYQQAADAATSVRAANLRLTEARRAVADSDIAYQVITARYKAGLASYLDVLQVEDRRLQAWLAEAAVRSAARSADVAMVRALGGGFAVADGNSTIPSHTDAKDKSHG